MSLNKKSRIFIAGHKGMVGSAILRCLRANGYTNIITRTRDELDLLDQRKTRDFLNIESPQCVFLAAAKVGGIQANNTYRADFLYENLAIQMNVINGSYLAGVAKIVFLGSSCIYPRDCDQPIKEEYLLSGPLEHTNEPYAIAKIAGIKLCESYNDQYDTCLLYTSPSPRDISGSRMPSSA